MNAACLHQNMRNILHTFLINLNTMSIQYVVACDNLLHWLMSLPASKLVRSEEGDIGAEVIASTNDDAGHQSQCAVHLHMPTEDGHSQTDEPSCNAALHDQEDPKSSTKWHSGAVKNFGTSFKGTCKPDTCKAIAEYGLEERLGNIVS